MSQFIAMNRFKIVPGMESEFEAIWKSRNTYLEEVPGFIRFNLVKGPRTGRSHTIRLPYPLGIGTGF